LRVREDVLEENRIVPSAGINNSCHLRQRHEENTIRRMRDIAVIGAGPGGLVAARYLKSEGMERRSESQRRVAIDADQYQPHYDLFQRSVPCGRLSNLSH
jgi:NADPH-dependent 2,4-dienoyl-CoA reductase/sulfur reductase-like enzyme